MKLALTGAGGFLGTELLAQLAQRAQHDDVDVLAVTSKADLAAAQAFPEGRITVVAPDDLRTDPDLMSGYDVLLNCAFPRNVDGAALARGLDFIAAVFAAAATRVSAVVNVSSQSVYSQRRTQAATEETPLCLESTYAVAKYATELMLQEACPGIPHTNIRLASLIGPGFDQRVVNKMVGKALAGEGLVVMDTQSEYCYFDVRDAASALITLCFQSNPASWQRVYNLGPDEGCSLMQIAQTVKRICDPIANADVAIDTQEDPLRVPIRLLLDSSRFRNAFHWQCCYSLEDTVRAIANRQVHVGDRTDNVLRQRRV